MPPNSAASAATPSNKPPAGIVASMAGIFGGLKKAVLPNTSAANAKAAANVAQRAKNNALNARVSPYNPIRSTNPAVSGGSRKTRRHQKKRKHTRRKRV